MDQKKIDGGSLSIPATLWVNYKSHCRKEGKWKILQICERPK